MYDVMIVDDEKVFREAFAQIIPWKQYGFHIVGMAQNGKEAIDILNSSKCDVMFTDIEMPVLDGIQLMDYVHEKYPEIIIIVLSCYNEFEYAKAALQKGAKDYITKLSITPQNMENLLLKLKKDIDKRNVDKRKKRIVDEQFAVNVEEGIRRLIVDSDFKGFESLEMYATMDGWELPQKYDAILYFEGNKQNIEAAEKEIFEETDKVSCGIMKISVSALEKVYLICGDYQYYVNKICCMSDYLQNIKIDIYKKQFELKRISNIVKNYFGHRKELSFFFCEPLYQLEENINIWDSEELKNFKQIYYQWCDNIQFSTYKRCTLDNCQNPEQLKEIIKRETNIILEKADHILEEKTGSPHLQRERIDQINGLSDINEIFAGNYCRFIEILGDFNWDEISDSIRKVILYIQKQDGFNMTLNEGAEIAHMAPQYFSVQFKKQTGINFINYLNQLKIEYAKNLLENTELKSYEIGMKIGIDNEGYFSRFFKKYTGHSPYKYRNRGRGV